MGAPNDEAVAGHRLYARGLDEVRRIGEVQDSELIASIIREARVHPSFTPDSLAGLVHHVVLTKEAVVEVVAHSMSVRRVSGETLDAAVTALRG